MKHISFVAQQMSSRNNLYFDTDVKTSPSESMQIQVMGNSQSKRTLFLQKHKAKSPVKLTGLSPTKSEVFFYNSNIGSCYKDLQSLSFAYVVIVLQNDQISVLICQLHQMSLEK